nr:hypothetical protein [Tanacetum cinerariifolium]
MVAILEKSDAAQGFEQIIDFLTGSYIHHALTVNPLVYISCIKQFWNTAVVKRSGDITRLQALVDKKMIVISEEVVREILQLNDAEGVICLPNDEIFAGLARMGYEKPSTKLTFYKAFFSTQWKFFIHTILHSLSAKRSSWNEFSSAMASALICLSSGQRFNFSKYIFESLVRNVDSTSKFYMYPRVGKGFSGVETSLFENMLADRAVDAEEEVQVPAQDDVVQEHVIEEIATEVVPPTPTSPSPSSPVIPSTPPHQSPSLPQQQATEEDEENVFNQGRMSVDMETDEGIELEVDQEKNAEVEGRQADTQAEIYNIDLDHSSKVLSMQEDTEVQEAVEVVTTAKLITEVITAVATQVATASAPIPTAKPAAKPKVLKIADVPAVSTRRRKGVVIRDPKEELHIDTPAETPTVKDKELQEELEKGHEEAYKQIDWNASFDHVQAKETQYIKRYHGFKKKPQSESEARKNMISYLKNTEGYKMEFFKGKTYDQILLVFQARFDANMKFLFKSREEMEKEDKEIIKSINETPAQKVAKRRKLNEEAQEADNLRGRLEIVPEEDDDVFVEAIPLAQKAPVVDYQVVMIDNRPRYKIIRADDTHQFYISFTTLLKNFDREDLEALWRIVKDRFSTKKPTNFLDEYLLLTLKTMFRELDEQDAIWRNQKSVHGLALVKRWKFTLEQLVNVARLQVEEESEMSLELLRSEENTKCVSAASEELTTAKHKLMLLI